jgi:hypothetical protein
MSEKKKWHKPELVVLVRNKPEEAVLGGCKLVVGAAGGPENGANGCWISTPGVCSICVDHIDT